MLMLTSNQNFASFCERAQAREVKAKSCLFYFLHHAANNVLICLRLVSCSIIFLILS